MIDGLTLQMQQNLATLKEQFESGEITKEVLSNKMERAIYKELAKPAEKINNAWLDACADLMAYADHEQIAQWPDEKETMKATIQRKLHRKQHSKPSWALRPAICAAACIVLMMTGITLSWSWFRPSQSIDEQVYTLTGQQVEIGTDNNAVADSSIIFGEYDTADFQELCDFLGYVPQMPTWVPNGWKLSSYHASMNHKSVEITAAYEKSDEEYLLVYDHIRTEDVSAVSADYYQDKTGEYVTLSGNMEIYLAANIGNPVAVWTTADTVSSVTGPISVEDLKALILSIQ